MGKANVVTQTCLSFIKYQSMTLSMVVASGLNAYGYGHMRFRVMSLVIDMVQLLSISMEGIDYCSNSYERS